MASNSALLDWSAIQAHIVTGGGQLQARSELGRDYEESDLPHFYLRNLKTHKQFQEWLSQGDTARSNLLCGCWYRPIFAGGGKQDTDRETEAFNLQTPSIFIDMRIPRLRPTEHLRSRSSLSECTNDELRIISRQHCFAGYTLPSHDGSQCFTRHHVIDWNYHPRFPRPRPNKWSAALSVDRASFMEYSFVQGSDGKPVYYEQWLRRSGDSEGRKYFACRKSGTDFRSLPASHTSSNDACGDERDAVFIIVGNYFCIAIDRPTPLPPFTSCTGPAGPVLIDQTLLPSLDDAAACERRESCVRYLDLEGSFGRVRNVYADLFGALPDGTYTGCTFIIDRSTHPWREGKSLFDAADSRPVKLVTHGVTGTVVGIEWRGGLWDVLENSFSAVELSAVLCNRTPTSCL